MGRPSTAGGRPSEVGRARRPLLEPPGGTGGVGGRPPTLRYSPGGRRSLDPGSLSGRPLLAPAEDDPSSRGPSPGAPYSPRRKTISPSTMVISTFMSRIVAGSISSRFRSTTVMSASFPAFREPRTSSSKAA